MQCGKHLARMLPQGSHSLLRGAHLRRVASTMVPSVSLCYGCYCFVSNRELLSAHSALETSAKLDANPWCLLRSAASLGKRSMGTQKLCACDRTRQSAIGVEIDLVDTVEQPFAAIVKDLSDVSEDGLWLNPFRGIPRGPRLSRFDVIYLDENCRVLEYAENFTEVEFEPLAMSTCQRANPPGTHPCFDSHPKRRSVQDLQGQSSARRFRCMLAAS